MCLYIVVYLFLCSIAFLAQKANKRSQLYLGLISAIVIVLFQAFRWRTGTDWIPYYDCFKLSNIIQVEYVEFGYYYLNKFVNFFSDSYSIFLLIECAIICFCISSTAKFFGVHNISAILLFSFASTIFPVRYTLAVAIYTYSYRFLVTKDFKYYFLFWAIATSFHSIVALAFPFYFIVNRHFLSKTILSVYITSCCIGLMSEFVFANMIEGVSLFFNYLPEFSQNKLNAYMVENEESRPLLSLVISYINGLLFISLFLYIRDKYKVESTKYDILLNMYVFGLCLGRIVIGAVPYLARLIACFSQGFSIILLIWLSCQKNNGKKMSLITSKILLLLFCVYYFVVYYKQISFYKDLYIPYYSIISNTTRPVVY